MRIEGVQGKVAKSRLGHEEASLPEDDRVSA
jgi:hypothetical protein